ncbi:MAG: hypothetical protein WBP45_03205 [Daejeonella sp.]
MSNSYKRKKKGTSAANEHKARLHTKSEEVRSNLEAQYSLKHLHYFHESIKTILDRLQETKCLEKDLYYPLIDIISIKTCSFFDELKRFSKEIKANEPRYEVYLEKESYIIGIRNKYFPDIKKLRNNALAHNLRIRDDKADKEEYNSILKKQQEYIVPVYPSEIIINVRLISLMVAIIDSLYPEIKSAASTLKIYIPQAKSRNLITDENYSQIFDEIDVKINELKPSVIKVVTG